MQTQYKDCVSFLGEQPKKLANVMVKAAQSITVKRSYEFLFFLECPRTMSIITVLQDNGGNSEGLKIISFTIKNSTRQNLHPCNLMMSIQMSSCS